VPDLVSMVPAASIFVSLESQTTAAVRQAFRPRNTSMMNAAAQSIRPSLVRVRVGL